MTLFNTKERVRRRAMPAWGRTRAQSAFDFPLPLRRAPQFKVQIIDHQGAEEEEVPKTPPEPEVETEDSGLQPIELPKVEEDGTEEAPKTAPDEATAPQPEGGEGAGEGGAKTDKGGTGEARPETRERAPQGKSRKFRIPNPLHVLVWMLWFINPLNWFRGLGDGRSFGENLGRLFVQIIFGIIVAALWPLIVGCLALAAFGKNDDSGIVTLIGIALLSLLVWAIWSIALPVYLAGAVIILPIAMRFLHENM